MTVIQNRGWSLVAFFLIASVGFFLFQWYTSRGPSWGLPWARPMVLSEVEGLGFTDERPPLSELINANGNISGDVQFLLDFAIVGHPKTATTALMTWLAAHREVLMYTHEIHSLFKGKPAELVQLLYELPAGNHYKRGYKLPTDIQSLTALGSLRQYWPQTKLIVGVRHPVKWLESFVNFRARAGNNNMPPAEELAGENLPSRIFFHNHLSMLGKTNTSDPIEKKLLTVLTGEISKYEYMPNEVFLYDVSQPFDSDETRNKQFRHDMQTFLGLSEPLQPMEARTTSRNFHYAIDICDDRYKQLRSDIMRVSRAASTWIRTYFLQLPEVTVSSPDHFVELLDSWMEDPCENKNVTVTPSMAMQNDEKRPPLSELVHATQVTGDVQFLLDFAIVGHAKCATTDFMHWIGKRDDVQMYKSELRHLTNGKPALFVKEMYKLPAGSQYKRGYKAPNDISHQTPRSLLREYFPHAGLIIGIRHPVKWFESWYNFHVRQGDDMPPPDHFRGAHLPFQVKFHTHVAMMGKTPLSEQEMELLTPYLEESDESSPKMNHPVFLYEVSQPFDKNETRNELFREKLSSFIGLPSTLEPLSSRTSSRNFHFAMDICEDKYQDLRQELLELGESMSSWFLTYFMDLDDVTISSPMQFREILSTWGDDPCVKERAIF